MSQKNRSRELLLGVMAVGFMPVAFAADAGSAPGGTAADNGTLDEVIVTAEKRPERLQDVPVALTVVSAAQLEDQHVTTLADLSRTTPALEVIQSFGGPGGGGQIRGIGTQSFTHSAEGAVGVVVDGVSQGNVNINNIFDTQQIEVLRGPQGTLFGLTSSAGVINLTTNAPDPAKFETIWHGDYASHGTAGSEFGQETLHGVVNIPLTADSALRIAASLDDYRGVQHDSYTGRDDTSENYGLRAHYLLKGEVFKVSVIADYQLTHQNGVQGGAPASFTYVYADPALTTELAKCGITPGWGNQDRCADHSQIGSDTNYGLSVQVDWDLGANTLTSISAYRRDETGPNAQDIQAEPFESPQLWSTGTLGASRIYSEELRIASNHGGPVDYTAGLFYSNYLTNVYYTPNAVFNIQPVATPYFPPAPPGFGPPLGTILLTIPNAQPVSTTTSEAEAIFGQMTYHITDPLALIAGARFQHQQISDFETEVADTTFLSLNQNNLSGKIGAQYKFNQAWIGYATVTKGYKGFQIQAATPTTPTEVIPAEIPTSYEIGLKGETLENRLGVDFSLFDTKVHNFQGQTCALNPDGVLVCLPNSFDVTTKGVEIDLYGRPIEHLTLNGGFIYDQAEYPSNYMGENPNNLTGTASSLLPMGGLQLVGVPKEKFTLSADYTVPLGAVSWFLSADTVYKSDIREGYSPDPRFVYPAHWVVGLRTGIRSEDGRWGVSAFARDINNAHEPLTLFGGPAFSAPAPYGPFFNPAYPNGQISGVSGWIGSQSLREVGLSFDFKL